MTLNIITQPVIEPVSPANVEAHCRIDDLTSEQDTVELLISSVRQRAESITRRALITQTWELVLNRFPFGRTSIELPLPPLQSITHIKYFDTNGVEQTLNSSLYRVIKNTSVPSEVMPVYGTEWPSTLDDSAVVTIRFVCGYGDSADKVPAAIIQWMLLNIATLYENRETLVVGGKSIGMVDLKTIADGLLENFRIYKL